MDAALRREVAAPTCPLSDEEVALRVIAGDVPMFEVLMRRHNQRVYRTVRSVLRDDSAAEDVMQQAWLAAYAHLSEFRGASRLSTWLTRIAVHEAFAHLRRGKRLVLTEDLEGEQEEAAMPERKSPEEATQGRELVAWLERAVEGLPEILRTVFVLREVEGMDTADTAEALAVGEDVVKTRLHRARTALRERLLSHVDSAAGGAFPFLAPRCNRVVAAVLAAIGAP